MHCGLLTFLAPVACFLTERAFCVLIGVKDWQEIIGIMTDKESQADEEILIYAMTLINKVRSKLHHNFVVRKKWSLVRTPHSSERKFVLIGNPGFHFACPIKITGKFFLFF